MQKYIEKFESNVENDKLLTILKEVSKETVSCPFDSDWDSITELEFKRRDGFIPYSHNKGGIDLMFITSIKCLVSTGCGLPKELRAWIYDQEKMAEDYIKKEHPKVKEGSDEFFELFDDYLSGEYNDIMYRVRIMYHGHNELTVFNGFDLDAPYFRGNFRWGQEKKIKFKNKKDLALKLKKYLATL